MSFSKHAVPAVALVLGSLCQVVVAQTSLIHRPGQSAQSATPSKNRTVFDAADAVTAAAATATTGKFVANFTVKLVTPVPSGYQVLCTLSAQVVDENTSTNTETTSNYIQETATSKATVSGSTAACTVNIPYSWYLTSSSTDTVELQYELTYLSTSATSSPTEPRFSTQYVPGAGAIKVPANGATTTYTISATM